MSDDTVEIVPWAPQDAVVIAPSESSPAEIVRHGAASLSSRDMRSITAAFEGESYEMVSAFVWSKASATLKKQLGSLGMGFVGEMLGRPDLDDDSDPNSIGDHEVILLAEDLSMITSTQALRLKRALELVLHYSQLENSEADEDPMQREEALSLLKSCVTAILAQPKFSAAAAYASFREGLRTRTLLPDDPSLQSVTGWPYFFVRTTMSVLLSMTKGEKGAPLEHAVGNVIVMLPVLWGRLRGPERWQVGQAYAEVNAAGGRLAARGLKKALLSVNGFDYVPESLRSNSFTEAAARVLVAHFGADNFYKEPPPMRTLANLGTAIPMPAFSKCLEAALAVFLGNSYGISFKAQGSVEKLIKPLRATQWEFYFEHCLPGDRTVLDKLGWSDKSQSRWMTLMQDYVPEEVRSTQSRVQKLVEAGRSGDRAMIQEKSRVLRARLSKSTDDG